MDAGRLTATVHVMPVGDLIEHDNSGDTVCVCGPTTEAVKDPATGAVGRLITHHCLDGRERTELPRRKPTAEGTL